MSHLTQELARKSYLAWSAEPFAGALHDFSVPLRKRADSRKVCGPYYMKPGKPGAGLGFYMASKGFACAAHGARFRLRLSPANDHLSDYSRLARIDGYFCDDYGMGETLQPIVALLSHGRGYLAGWTMGAGMCAALDGCIYESDADAAYAAHSMAQHDAERERDSREADADTE